MITKQESRLVSQQPGADTRYRHACAHSSMIMQILSLHVGQSQVKGLASVIGNLGGPVPCSVCCCRLS